VATTYMLLYLFDQLYSHGIRSDVIMFTGNLPPAPADKQELLLKWSEEGNTAAVRELLSTYDCSGIINRKNNDGDTALILASSNGHKDIVSLLLSSGAAVNDKNNNGWTALSGAKTEEIKSLLRAKGAK
jgi:ankyrin repeat protein